MSRSEIDAAWDSAEYNAKRAEIAEARVAELEAESEQLRRFIAGFMPKGWRAYSAAARAALEGKSDE